MIQTLKINLERYGTFYCLHKKGFLFREVNEYLIEKAMKSGRNNGKLAKSSQRQYAYVFKQLFDYLDNNNLEWDEINADALRYLVYAYDDMPDGPKRPRINYMSYLWSEFYLWCTHNGYKHNVNLNYNETEIPRYGDKDFLAHIRKGKKSSMRTELYLPHSKKEHIRFIGNETLTSLLNALGKIDPVYETIAYFMVTSGLRISGALQLNIDTFPPYVRVPHLKWLEYEYIPKGHFDTKQTKILKYSMRAWMHISDTYISTAYKRGEMHFKKNGILPKEFFLKATSNPVRNFDIWDAFKIASEEIDIKVTPHMLRHTYAVFFVKKYAKEKGVSLSAKAFLWDVHEQLRLLLGHIDIQTTMLYCRLAEEITSLSILDDIAEEIIIAKESEQNKESQF